MPIRLNLLIATSLASSLLLLAGCTTGVVNPPKGTPTMKQAYYGAMQDNDHVTNTGDDNGVNQGNRNDGRFDVLGKNVVTLPSMAGALQSDQVLAEQVTNGHNFPLLPNPQVMLYIYPHFEGTDQMPVHGNWTTFPMYQTNHYALPSEVQT